MISSACIEHLDFLDSIGDMFTRFEEKNVTQSFKSLTEIPKLPELVDDGTFHRCFIPSFGSFGQAVSEEKIKKISQSEKKNCLWWPCLLIDRDKKGNL
jgi:hypothetical protein